MPTIEPPKFAEGADTNMLSSLADKVGNVASSYSGMRYGQRSAMKMQQKHHENNKDLITHAYNEQSKYDEGAVRNQIKIQTLSHKQSKDLESHKAGLAANEISLHHKNAMEAGAQGHEHTLDLINKIHKGAESGSDISIKTPTGAEVSYTRKARTAKQKASPSFAPVKLSEEAQAEPPAAPEKSAAPAKKEFALRINHPDTGVLVRQDSLSPEQLKKALAKQKGNKKPPKKK